MRHWLTSSRLLLVERATCSLLWAGHKSCIWGLLSKLTLILLETIRIRVSMEHLLDLLNIGVIVPLGRDDSRRERLHVANLSFARLFTASTRVLHWCGVELTLLLTRTSKLFSTAELRVLLLLEEFLLSCILLVYGGLATVFSL